MVFLAWGLLGPGPPREMRGKLEWYKPLLSWFQIAPPKRPLELASLPPLGAGVPVTCRVCLSEVLGSGAWETVGESPGGPSGPTSLPLGDAL